MVMKILSRVSSQKRIALFFMLCLHLMPVGGVRWVARGSSTLYGKVLPFCTELLWHLCCKSDGPLSESHSLLFLCFKKSFHRHHQAIQIYL